MNRLEYYTTYGPCISPDEIRKIHHNIPATQSMQPFCLQQAYLDYLEGDAIFFENMDDEFFQKFKAWLDEEII